MPRGRTGTTGEERYEILKEIKFQCLVGGRERHDFIYVSHEERKVSMPRGRTGTTFVGRK